MAEDDELVARVYRRILERYGVVSVVATVKDGLAIVATRRRLTGLVIDVFLPDGTGIEIAQAARATWWAVPVLVASGGVDEDTLDAAAETEALYLLKPVRPERLERWAERAVNRERREELLLTRWADRYALSPAETITLRLAIDGLRRDEIARERGVREGTAKVQIHTLVQKLDVLSLSEAVANFYRALSGLSGVGDDHIP